MNRGRRQQSEWIETIEILRDKKLMRGIKQSMKEVKEGKYKRLEELKI